MVNANEIDPKLYGEIEAFVAKAMDKSKVDIKGVFLGGSHSKGTSNVNSDIDLQLYVKYPLKSLLGVCPAAVNINTKIKRVTIEGATTFYIYKGRKYELNIIPLKTPSSTKKELIYGLYRQNIDVYFKFVKAILVVADKDFLQFREDILTKYHIGKDHVYGYYSGYMTSQLQKHKRRSDAERRATRAMLNNDAMPLVKLTIDGLYMAFSGILLLEEQRISRNFVELYRKYRLELDLEERKFVNDCINRKLHGTPISMPLNEYVTYAMNARDKLFGKLNTRLKAALENSSLPILTHSLRKRNERLLNKYVYKIYGLQELPLD